MTQFSLSATKHEGKWSHMEVSSERCGVKTEVICSGKCHSMMNAEAPMCPFWAWQAKIGLFMNRSLLRGCLQIQHKTKEIKCKNVQLHRVFQSAPHTDDVPKQFVLVFSKQSEESRSQSCVERHQGIWTNAQHTQTSPCRELQRCEKRRGWAGTSGPRCTCHSRTHAVRICSIIDWEKGVRHLQDANMSAWIYIYSACTVQRVCVCPLMRASKWSFTVITAFHFPLWAAFTYGWWSEFLCLIKKNIKML